MPRPLLLVSDRPFTALVRLIYQLKEAGVGLATPAFGITRKSCVAEVREPAGESARLAMRVRFGYDGLEGKSLPLAALKTAASSRFGGTGTVVSMAVLGAIPPQLSSVRTAPCVPHSNTVRTLNAHESGRDLITV